MGGVVEVSNVDGPDGDTDQGDNLRTQKGYYVHIFKHRVHLYTVMYNYYRHSQVTGNSVKLPTN